MSILEHFQAPSIQFTPSTPREFFAMQLARRLDDVRRVRDYVLLAEKRPQDEILAAYRHAFEGFPEARVPRFWESMKTNAQ